MLNSSCVTSLHGFAKVVPFRATPHSNAYAFLPVTSFLARWYAIHSLFAESFISGLLPLE
jgi:hypothetical protein